MCKPPSSAGSASLSRCLCSWDTQYDSHRSLPFCVACMLQFHGSALLGSDRAQAISSFPVHTATSQQSMMDSYSDVVLDE